MDQLRSEDLSVYDSPWLTLTELGPLSRMPIRRALKRDDNLRLVLEVTYDGAIVDQRSEVKEGTFLQDEERIIFESKWGVRALAKRVLSRGWSSHGRSGRMETLQTFTIDSIQISNPNELPEKYHVEWLCNLPAQNIWPNIVDSEEAIESKRKLIWPGGFITMRHVTKTEGGARAGLYLNASGYRMFIVTNGTRDIHGRISGFMVCEGIPKREALNKILDAISFTLGRPIISLGHTIYNEDWFAVSSESVSPYTNDGKYFDLHTLPPFPVVSSGTRNTLEQQSVEKIVNSLLGKYDSLGFQYLNWAYWHATCAPYHMEAAHLGALIENIQSKTLEEVLGAESRGILSRTAWRILRQKITPIISAEGLSPEAEASMLRQINETNRVPQKQILSRLCSAVGAPIGDVELEAWGERNNAAHGNNPENHIDTILNAKILRIIMHRLVGGYTNCSDKYNDYYSIGFPVRQIADTLPRRADHGSTHD